MTVALIAFLAARLDEDEAAAEAAAEDDGADWFANAKEGWDADERSVMYTGPSTLRPGGTWDYPVCRSLSVGAAEHIARHDPARVLREVEAGRTILAEHFAEDRGESLPGADCGVCYYIGTPGSPAGWPCRTLRALAAVWSDHPDYDQEWALADAETRETGLTP